MAAFIFYASILYTLSRGAIVTAGLVFVGWFVWMFKTKKIRVVVFTIVFLLISSVVLIWANPQVYQKFASTLRFLPSSGQISSNKWGDEWDVSLDPSSAGRLERWEKIIDTFKEKPLFAIFGVGYSTDNLQKFTGVSSTHSLFLDLWARGGILALLLAIAIWIYLLGTVFRFFFSGDSEVRTFCYLLFGFALGWFLDNLISGEQFFSDAPMIAFWGVLGLVESLRQIGKKSFDSAQDRKKVLIALTSADPGGAPQVVYDLLSRARSKDFEFVVAAPPGGFLQKFRTLGYRKRSARFLYISLEKMLARFTARFINVSSGQEREGLTMKLFPKSKSRVVVNGVDTAVGDRVAVNNTSFRRKLGLGSGDLVVTMIARFDPVKGHERLVGMLPELLKKIPNLKIVFAGDGERRSGTERLPKKLGVSSAVRFLGQRSDVFKIFKVSDAAILSSYHEGMPLTVLEAMACRLPVVGSDAVGIRDLVKDGETGYLVDFDHGSGQLIKSLSKL